MTTKIAPYSDWTTLRLLRMVVLGAGPFVTLMLSGRIPSTTLADVAGREFAVTLLWSPLFFAIPALLLQRQRDLALAGVRPWFWRGLRLLPHLLFSKDSTVRPETAVSLSAWLVLLGVTGSSAVEVIGRILAG